MRSGNLLWELSEYDKADCVELDPAGKFVRTSHDRGLINLWDMGTGTHLIEIDGRIEYKRIASIKLSPTGKHIIAFYKGGYIYSTGRDNVVQIWNVDTGKLVNTIRGLSNAEIDPKGRYVAGSKESKKTKVVRTPMGFAEVKEEDKKEAKYQDLFGDTACQKVKIWNLDTGNLKKTLEGHTDEVNKIIIDPTSRFIIGVSYSGVLSIWNVESGTLVKTLTISDERLYKNDFDYMQVDSGGRFLIYRAMNSKTARIWELESGNALLRIEDSNNLMSVMVEPTQRFAISLSPRTIKIWDITSDKLVRTIEESYVNKILIDPSGKYIVTSKKKTIKVWDMHTGKILNTLEGHSDRIYLMHIPEKSPLPDSPVIISKSMDGTINVWDLVTGKLQRSSVFASAKAGCRPSPTIMKGDYIVSRDKNNMSKIWNVLTDKSYTLEN